MKNTLAIGTTITAALATLLSLQVPTFAAIIVPNQSITVDGSALFNGQAWEYRYTITDKLGAIANPVRFIISEHPTHAGLHHEFNFQNNGGNFQYDFPVPPPFQGISKHNYFWNDLGLPANGSIIIGFDDEHGPKLASWGIQARGQHIELQQLLPVPSVTSVPEPITIVGSITALGLGVMLKKEYSTKQKKATLKA